MRQGTLYLPPNTKMPQLASVFGMLATICGLFTEFHSIIPTFKLVAAALLTLAAILPVEKQYASMLLPAGLLVLSHFRRIFQDLSALPAFLIYLLAWISMGLTSSGILRGKGAAILFCGLAPIGYGVVSLIYNLRVIAETQADTFTQIAYRLHQIGCLYPLFWGITMLILTAGLRPYRKKKTASPNQQSNNTSEKQLQSQ